MGNIDLRLLTAAGDSFQNLLTTFEVHVKTFLKLNATIKLKYC
jgi:hypothetical protein